MRQPRGARLGEAGGVRRAQTRCGMRTEMAQVRGGARDPVWSCKTDGGGAATAAELDGFGGIRR
jgi:hypothetical protein